jgi:predicted HTH domain antitoxin
MKILSVRIDDELNRKLDFMLENLKKKDKSSYVRKLLEKSLNDEMLDVLGKMVEEKSISMWKAAEMIGLSLRKMMEELKARNITGYDEKAIFEDIEFATD